MQESQISEIVSPAKPQVENANPNPLRKKRMALVALMLLYYGMGFCISLAAPLGQGMDKAVQLIFGLIAQVFIIYWFILDAKERGYTISKTLFIMLVALGFLAIPYYFIKTRRKKALAPILYCLLLLIAFGSSETLGEWVGRQMPAIFSRIRSGK